MSMLKTLVPETLALMQEDTDGCRCRCNVDVDGDADVKIVNAVRT